MDNSLKPIVLFFAFLTLICFLVGWSFLGFMIVTIPCVLIAESLQAKKKEKEAAKAEEPVMKIDLGNGTVLTDEQKIARLPVGINNLKYQNEEQLNDILPKISAMYGISIVALWAAVNAAKDNMLKAEQERDEEINDLELEDLDEDEREELLDDFDDVDDVEDCDDFDDFEDEDVDDDDNDDDWSSHDSFDAHDTFDSHDSFGANDSWGVVINN